MPEELGSASALCDLCGREVVSNREEHYRGHLENAKAYIDLVERRGDDPSASEGAEGSISEWTVPGGRNISFGKIYLGSRSMPSRNSIDRSTGWANERGLAAC